MSVSVQLVLTSALMLLAPPTAKLPTKGKPTASPVKKRVRPGSKTSKRRGVARSRKGPKGAVVIDKQGFVDLNKMSPMERHLAERGGLDPVVSGQAMQVLRDYAEGASGPMKSTVGRSRKVRSAAKRIVARIDALPASQRTKALGAGGGKGKGKGGKPSALSPSAYGPGPAHLGLTVFASTLPAEGIPKPSSYDVQLAGLYAGTVAEGDGTDELVPVAAYITGTSSGYHRHVAHLGGTGAVALNAGQVADDRVDLYEGTFGGVLASAVFEADGDAPALRAEFEAMVGLAESLALQVGGNQDPLVNMAWALDYSAGLLALSDPEHWGPGTVIASALGNQGDVGLTLHGLYATPSQSANGVDHKHVHHHQAGGGSYDFMFDVPAPEVATPNVRVTVDKIQVIEGVDEGADQDDLHLKVWIGDESVHHKLTPNKDVHTFDRIVQRKMVSTEVPIYVELTDHSRPKKGYTGTLYNKKKCGDWGDGKDYLPCKLKIRELDVSPVANTNWGGEGPSAGSIVVDVGSGQVSGDVSGNVANKVVLQGNHGHRARVELKIEIIP